jgi:hypothetical protein
VNDFQMAAKNFLSPQDYAEYRTGALDETSEATPNTQSRQRTSVHVY